MRFSNTEWQVMNVLWEQHPRRVRDVLEILEAETGWAYSTVKTILARLAEKGAVDVERQGNVHHYSPRVSREVARRSALRSLLDRAFDGTVGTLVHHLVDTKTMDSDEREVLGELLASAAAEDAAVEEAKASAAAPGADGDDTEIDTDDAER